MTIVLRDYQKRGIEAIRDAYRRGRRAPLYVLATGAGKTVMFSYLTYHAARRGGRVIILVHRDHLVRQSSDALTEWGCPHGVIFPTYPERHERPVQVASVQSLRRRIERWTDYDPTLIVIDEGHHATASTWTKIIEAFPTAKLLSVTATPARLDGKGLIRHFDDLILGPSMQELILNGYLAQYRMFAPQVRPDLSGVRRAMGDFKVDALAAVMDVPTLTGDAVKHYDKHLAGAPSIAFAVTVKHASHIAEQFRKAGRQATVIEGNTDPIMRKQMLRDLGTGQLNVLCSCEVISEGVDVPVCQGAILLRPTESVTLYLQQVGRALRPKPDGSDAVILDHAGNSLRHGLPDDDRVWSLADGLVATNGRKRPGAAIRTCSMCFAIFAGTTECPVCGHDNKVERDLPRTVDGELSEQHPAFIAKAREIEQSAKMQKTLDFLQRKEERMGYRPGWHRHVFRAAVQKEARKQLEKELT
jgi:DNA repair protein RadD